MTTVDPRPALMAWPPRPPRVIAGVPVGVLACWLATLLLALSIAGRPLWYVTAAALGIAVLAAASGWRRDGRWAYEWVWLWLRYRTRRRAAAAGPQPPELALLDLAGRVRTVGDVDTEAYALAVVEHLHGCTAVLELSIDSAARTLPELPFALTPPHDEDAPPLSVQLIVHTRPIPASAAHARAWLAVQARRSAGHPTAELRAAVASAVRRVLRHARQAGLAVQVLDAARLREALHVVTRLELVGRARFTPVGLERWRTWWTGDVPQRCLRIRSWPGLPGPPGPEVYHALLATPTIALTLAVAARRLCRPVPPVLTRSAGLERADVIAVELVVRIAERDGRLLDGATRHLCGRLGAVGARVERLEGRQHHGLAATLPFGGFVPVGSALRCAGE